MRLCFVVVGVHGRHANMKRAFGMAPHLIRAGDDITICLEEAAENRAAISGIPGCKALWFRKASVWKERQDKSRLLRHERFDFIHLCGLGWRNALLPGLELASPAIMEHTELESSFLGTCRVRRAAQWILEAASLLYYSNSVVVSHFLEGLFQRRSHTLGIRRHILYLPFAGDIAIQDPGSERPPEIGGDLGNRKLLIYMGNLYPAYGVFDMLAALRELTRIRRDWVCCWIGDGPARAELETRTKAAGLEGLVRFLGRCSEAQMAPCMKAASVFVSPLQDTVTDWARCPGKTFIYMMYEKPIVTCRVGESLHCLGDDGFYYTPGDPDSMCSAIQRALDAPSTWRPRYRREDYTWQARAKQYREWLLTLQET